AQDAREVWRRPRRKRRECPPRFAEEPHGLLVAFPGLHRLGAAGKFVGAGEWVGRQQSSGPRALGFLAIVPKLLGQFLWGRPGGHDRPCRRGDEKKNEPPGPPGKCHACKYTARPGPRTRESIVRGPAEID